MGKVKFTSWQLWSNAPDIPSQILKEILDGGQAFRWQKLPNYFEGRWSRHVFRLRSTSQNRIEYAIPETCDAAREEAALANYFASDIDFPGVTGALPWRSDPVLRNAIDAFPGLRILRQPLSETLFCFLCSSAKQIPHIKAICEATAKNIGSELPDGSFALPDWPTLAQAGESALRSVGLGYRARYIHQCACFLREHPAWLDATSAAPTDTARQRLMSLPGVGPKIADCVLLFGMGRLEAFPIDTWIAKILSSAYGLKDWPIANLQDFARVHFGEASGYAQQYLFSAARAGIIEC